MRNEMELPIGDKTYRIKKFTPDLACAWAFKVIGASSTGLDPSSVINGFLSQILKDPEEYKRLRYDALSHVSFVLEPSGRHSVVNGEGFLNDLSLTGPDLLKLISASFSFSMSDFFDRASLADLVKTIGDIFRTTGTSNSSPSPSLPDTGLRTTSGTENTPLPTSSIS